MAAIINVKIKFGNNNSFDMKLPITANAILLYSRFLEITRVKGDHVKYMICNGKILDKQATLRDLKIMDNKLLVHVVVSNEPTGSYPMDEILQNEYQLYYNISNGLYDRARTMNTIGSYQQNLNNFTDVVVTLTHDQFDSLTSSTTLDAEDIDLDSIDEATCFCGDDDNIDLVRTRTWLPCGHSFHSSCIRRYLTTTSVKCPMCGIDVRDEHT